MLAKLIFVLVIFSADGSATPFARFETAEQCQQFADSFNSGRVGGNRAMCMPENIKSELDFDQAIVKLTNLMNEMKRALNDETLSNQRPTP